MPGVTLSASPLSIVEGDTSTLTVSLPEGVGADGAVTVALSYDGDVNAYEGPASIVIGDGETAATALFTATNDDVDGVDVQVEVSIAAVTGDAVEVGSQRATLTIIDDDDPTPVVTLSLDPTSVSEGAGATLTATLSAALVEAVTVGLSTDGGTAEEEDISVATTILIPAGERSGTAAISTAEDDDFDDETVVVSISSVTGGAIEAGDQRVTLMVRDNDEPLVRLSVDPTSIAEGGTSTVTVALAGGAVAAGDVTVGLAYVYGDGTGGDGEFEAPAEVVIASGVSSATALFMAVDDDEHEDDVIVTVSIDAIGGRAAEDGDQAATIEIIDDDLAVVGLLINEYDSVVSSTATPFVEIRVDGDPVVATADGFALVYYDGDRRVVGVEDLDGLTTGADGFLVVRTPGSPTPQSFVGVTLVNGDGPTLGSTYDEGSSELVDAVFVDESDAAAAAGAAADQGSMQRQASGDFAFVVPPTPGTANGVGAPVASDPEVADRQAVVGPVYPNPTSGRAAVEIAVPEPQRVIATVYDALGRRVAVVLDREMAMSGPVQVSLGDAPTPGVFTVRVIGETFVGTRFFTVVE